MKIYSFVIVLAVFVFATNGASFSQNVPAVPASTNSLSWDVNGDGVVNLADLMLVGKHLGGTAPEADVNGDGLVNIADLVLVGVHFGEEYKPTKTTVNVAADSGKTIQLDDGAEVIIPPDILSDNTAVTMEVEDSPSMPTRTDYGDCIVGKVYNIEAGDTDLYGPVAIALPYDPALVPPGADEDKLTMAYWDGERWIAHESQVDTANHVITAQTNHLSLRAPWAWSNELPEVKHFSASKTTFNAISHLDIQNDLTFRVVVADEDGLDDIQKVYVVLKLYPLETVLGDELWKRWQSLWVDGISEYLGVGSYFLELMLENLDSHRKVVFPIYDRSRANINNTMNSYGVCKATIKKEFLQKMLFDPYHEIGTGPVSRFEAQAFVEDRKGVKESESVLVINVMDGWIHFKPELRSPSEDIIIYDATPTFSWSVEKKFIDNIPYKPESYALYIDDDPDPLHEWRFGWRIALSTNAWANNADRFTNPFLQADDQGDTIQFTYTLPEEDRLKPGTYHWAVTASDNKELFELLVEPLDEDINKNEDYDDDGKKDTASDIRTFTYEAVTPPEITLLKPANNSSEDPNPTFTWQISYVGSNDLGYGLYVDDDRDPFTDPLFYKMVGADTSFRYIDELSSGTYYWGVKAFYMDSAGNVIPGTEAFSDIWSFTVETPILYVSVAFLGFDPGESTKTFQIRNDGGGTLRWEISLVPEWLSISPRTGENDQVITATLDRSQIPAGTGKEDYFVIRAGSQYKDISVSVNPTMPGPNEIIGNDGAPMVLISAGEFQMGDAFNEGSSDERPVHTVYLDAFYMDKYEVTNAQYRKFMDATGHKEPYFWNDSRFNAPQQPVVGVSWYDAAAYAEWAGKRLPTEAEWEKAARGGLAGKRYPWGDEAPDSGGVYRANYDPGNDAADGYAYTAPVGSFPPNGYGLYDMAGNVWEWCADWWDSGYYANSPYNNPLGPDSGAYRVLRGRWLALRRLGLPPRGGPPLPPPDGHGRLHRVSVRFSGLIFYPLAPLFLYTFRRCVAAPKNSGSSRMSLGKVDFP